MESTAEVQCPYGIKLVPALALSTIILSQIQLPFSLLLKTVFHLNDLQFWEVQNVPRSNGTIQPSQLFIMPRVA